MAKSQSIEAAVQRWLARLEQIGDSIEGLEITLEANGRRCYDILLVIQLTGVACVTIATSHEDVYVAVSDAFRQARKALLERAQIPYLVAAN
jgi:hypothetical protein